MGISIVPMCVSSCHRLKTTGAHWRYEDFERGCAVSWWFGWSDCERRSFTTVDGSEILHQLIYRYFSPVFTGLCTSQVVQDFLYQQYVVLWCFSIWVFPKIGGKLPPNHPFGHRVFHYFHHPFWGPTPIFGNTHIPGPSKRCKSNPEGFELIPCNGTIFRTPLKVLVFLTLEVQMPLKKYGTSPKTFF